MFPMQFESERWINLPGGVSIDQAIHLGMT